MCKPTADSPNICSPQTCSGSCKSKLATAAELQEALATVGSNAQALTALPEPLRAAIDTLCRNTELSVKIRQAKGAASHQAATVLVRRIKRRADDGPISGEAITARMMEICGCNGEYDCDCVSAESQARIELWTAHNTAQRIAP